jgi:hypothetical protein
VNATELWCVALADAPVVVRGRITTRAVDLPGHRLVHARFDPGARWSVDAAPAGGTAPGETALGETALGETALGEIALCQRPHDAIVLSGTLGVLLPGRPPQLIPADHAFHLPAGHDAWCVGAEPCVLLEIEPAVTGTSTVG